MSQSASGRNLLLCCLFCCTYRCARCLRWKRRRHHYKRALQHGAPPATTLLSVLYHTGPVGFIKESRRRRFDLQRIAFDNGAQYSTAGVQHHRGRARRAISVLRKVPRMLLYILVLAAWAIRFLLSQSGLVFYILYASAGWLGVGQSPLYFCFHLLDIIYRLETLRIVLRAVTSNLYPLFVTILFLCVLVYIFSILGLVFFRNTFQSSASELMVCESLLHCFVFSLTSGLRCECFCFLDKMLGLHCMGHVVFSCLF